MTMKIQSKFHGVIDVLEDAIITFNHGILGFEDEKEFILLNLMQESESIFYVLQSIHTSTIAFITTNPFTFESSYEFDLKESEIEALSITNKHDVRVLSIMTLPKEGNHMTLNLLAPIIINHVKNTGMQVVLEGNTYTTKHSIKLKGE